MADDEEVATLGSSRRPRFTHASKATKVQWIVVESLENVDYISIVESRSISVLIVLPPLRPVSDRNSSGSGAGLAGRGAATFKVCVGGNGGSVRRQPIRHNTVRFYLHTDSVTKKVYQCLLGAGTVDE